MKKIMALLLSGLMIGGIAVSGTACGGFGKAKGTDGAKVLLARERLDETAITEAWNNIVEQPQKTAVRSEKKSAIKPMSASSGEVLSDTAAGKVVKKGETYEWSNFPKYSYNGEVVLSRFKNIEHKVSRYAEAIGELRKLANATNKWLIYDGHTQMLKVSENVETLYEQGEESFFVCRRTTSADARSTYEVYENYDQSDYKSQVYFRCTPGEAYEYVVEDENGFRDYMLAENSRGYWNFVVTARGAGSTSGLELNTFTNTVVGESLSYRFGVELTKDQSTMESYVAVHSGDLLGDVISCGKGETYGFTINLGAFNESIEKVVFTNTEESPVDIYEDVRGNTSYTTMPNEDTSLHLKNGMVINYGDSFLDGRVVAETVSINYSSGFSDDYGDHYNGSIGFHTTATTEEEFYDILRAFMKELDLRCAWDMETILNTVSVASEMKREYLQYYDYKGNKVDTYENINGIVSDYFADFAAFKAEYEGIEKTDPVRINPLSAIPASAALTGLKNISFGLAEYAEGTVKVKDASITLKGNALLEKGETYHLQIGLAKYEDGALRSENAIALQGTGKEATMYENKGLSLTQTGEYVLPKTLGAGRYAVVAYAANEDGIRVSEMAIVSFVSVEEGKLASEAMEITVSKQEDTMLVDYEVKLTVEATLAGTKSYSYEELRRAMLLKAMEIGYPMAGAKVETATGEPLDENASYVEGDFRLKFLVSTKDGVAEAYVTLALKREINM